MSKKNKVTVTLTESDYLLIGVYVVQSSCNPQGCLM